MNGGWGIFYEIALRWLPRYLIDDKSTLVQVMAWCRQATSHYLGQCWPRSMSSYGVTRPQWVKCLLISPSWEWMSHRFPIIRFVSYSDIRYNDINHLNHLYQKLYLFRDISYTFNDNRNWMNDIKSQCLILLLVIYIYIYISIYIFFYWHQ